MRILATLGCLAIFAFAALAQEKKNGFASDKPVSPTPLNVTLFVLAVVAWIGASLGIQGLVTWSRRRKA